MQPRERQIAHDAPGERRRPLLAIALALFVLGVALPGCGTSGSTVGSTQSSADARPKTEAGRSRHETRQDIVNAVQACKEGVDTGTWLPDASKRPLYENCELGLHRGLTEIKAYGAEVCGEVVFTSPAKDETERSRIFDACYAGVKRATVKVH